MSAFTTEQQAELGRLINGQADQGPGMILIRQLQGQTGGAPVRTTPPSTWPQKDGAVVDYFDASNGVVFRFKYRAASASAFKWELVGGPLVVSVAAGSMTYGAAAFTLLTGSPTVTLPLAGDYTLGGTIFMQNQVAALNDVNARLSVAGTILPPNGRVIFAAASLGGYSPISRSLCPGRAAGDVVDVRVMSNSAQNCLFFGATIEMQPLRVG